MWFLITLWEHSLNPTIFGCALKSIIKSAGRSMNVTEGMLCRRIGSGLKSATFLYIFYKIFLLVFLVGLLFFLKNIKKNGFLANSCEILSESRIGHLFLVVVRREYDRVVGARFFHRLADFKRFFKGFTNICQHFNWTKLE